MECMLGYFYVACFDRKSWECQIKLQAKDASEAFLNVVYIIHLKLSLFSLVRIVHFIGIKQ